jgi:hypothetical protein
MLLSLMEPSVFAQLSQHLSTLHEIHTFERRGLCIAVGKEKVV